MKLYIQRHGEAASKLEDPERGLTRAGRIGIDTLAVRLKNRGVCFDQALHSSKARARQTAEIMTSVLAPAATLVEYGHINPNDDPHVILAEIQGWHRDILISSHLPFVPALLELLQGNSGATGTLAFTPGAIACLNRLPTGKWQLEWFESP